MLEAGTEIAALSGRVDFGEAFFAVHYASESFLNARDEPMGIAAIAVHNLQQRTTQVFGRSDAPEGIDPELFVLDRFYDFLSANRDATFLHWNMGSAEFGFETIAKRYYFLRKTSPSVTVPRERLDVDKLIRRQFGDDYSPHPRLQGVARMNELDLRGFMGGADEAAAYTAARWNDIARSAATKAQLISDLFGRTIRGTLRTSSSAGRLLYAGAGLDAVSVVLAIAERFVLVQRRLARRPQNRTPLSFDDEYDDQYLMHALLAQYFDDIRAEDYVPEYAGGRSRVDFLLPDFGLALELKHTRDGLDDRRLGEELLIDVGRYKNARSAQHLIAIVFDLDGVLNNPRGLEGDLERKAGAEGIAVTVKIVDR